MTRGFRWQYLAFIGSLLVFAIALLTRPNISTPITPSQTPVSESTLNPLATASPTLSATSAPVLASPITTGAETFPPPNDLDAIPSYTEGLVGTLNRLNPLFSDLNPVDRDISSLIFEGLTRINEYGEPVADLARSWVISGDGLEYVFTLRDDVLWHDGTSFSAADVLYTIGLYQDVNYSGLAEVGAFWRTIEVQAIGEHLVRFRLTQPLASFLTKLNFGILPEHALRGTDALGIVNHRFNVTPIGTGPYQLEALGSSDGITVDVIDLRVSPNYRLRPEAQGKYALERLRFRVYPSYESLLQALQTAQVDGYAARDWNERLPLLDIPNLNIYSAIAPAVGMIIYNWQEADNQRFFRELRVRLGLMTGLNRQTPVEAHLTNRVVVANSPLLPNSWAYDSSLSYPMPDPFSAISAITSANVSDGNTTSVPTPDPNATSEGTPTAIPPSATPDPNAMLYRFTILVPEDPALIAIAREVAAQWSQYRLAVEVEAVPRDVFQQRLDDGQFMSAIVELPMGADPDVYAYWHVGQAPDGKNYGAVADDRLSELLERARRDSNGINRTQLYQQFQRRFIERAIAIPLYYPLYTYVVSDAFANVQLGVITSPTDRFRTLADWTLRVP